MFNDGGRAPSYAPHPNPTATGHASPSCCSSRAPRCPPRAPSKLWPSFVMPPKCIDGSCATVSQPLARDELVVFRKRYVCKMTEQKHRGDKEVPYSRTVSYTLETVWEQLELDDNQASTADALNGLQSVVIPNHSELAQCLLCAFDKSFIEEQPDIPCSQSVSESVLEVQVSK